MQINKLNQWLENSYQGRANQEILFINASKNHIRCNLLDLKRMRNSLKSNFRLLWLDGIEEIRHRYYENQIVAMLSQNIKYFETIKRTIARGVIYVEKSESINDIIALLQAKRVDVKGELSYTLLEKVEFEEILKLDVKSLREFILNRANLLKNIHYCFGWMEHPFLNDCLAIYYNKRILLANFAQYLYRLATLDFTSTDKSVGAAIHKILGIKSSVISLKSLKIKVDISLLKNHRVYILNENQLELDIKMGVAKKLVALDIKELDVNKIGNITELLIKQIEKFYSDCFIR